MRQLEFESYLRFNFFQEVGHQLDDEREGKCSWTSVMYYISVYTYGKSDNNVMYWKRVQRCCCWRFQNIFLCGTSSEVPFIFLQDESLLVSPIERVLGEVVVRWSIKSQSWFISIRPSCTTWWVGVEDMN